MAEAFCRLTPDQALMSYVFILFIGIAMGGGMVASIRDWRRGGR